ncbi:hypothetical protein [Nocardia crassostreae]|uniref:hypothetical protein n=1 Tax=Nocardia crassostreae TaxID=53428 RepID=UPI00082DFDF8|nr:hypothetical protein [Nocardia crassostreae]
MWHVPPPPHEAEAVFRRCVGRSRDSTRLLRAAQEVAAAAKRYETAATAGQLHTLRPAEFTSAHVTDRELQNTYTNRMVRGRSPGRAVYTEIRQSAPDQICPLCGHRTVASLDHALPKKHFPLLSVAPTNLVPCCSDCNHTKSEAIPGNPGQVYLHPYFDDIDDDIWLVAEIIESSPTAAIFGVAPPPHLTPTLAARVRYHFTSLGLANLYTTQAGSEIRALAYVSAGAHCRDGANGVREVLADYRDGRRRVHRNTWQAALFHALLSSDWYCDGGFRST